VIKITLPRGINYYVNLSIALTACIVKNGVGWLRNR